MAQQHKQAFCHQCDELTLHVGDLPAVPHVLHLLLTLLTCSVWLVVWLLHILANSSEQPTFLCSRCGQAERQKPKPARPPPRPLTAEEIALEAERQQARREIRRRRLAEVKTRIVWIWLLPVTLDALLRQAVGEENDLIYRFLQCLIVIASLGILILGIWLNVP